MGNRGRSTWNAPPRDRTPIRFRIEIETGNAAFNEDGGELSEAAEGRETARILRELADCVENGWRLPERVLWDVNGNRVGKAVRYDP